MTVVMELKMFLAQDPYRRPPGNDLEGRNIFKVSLARLDALKDLTGPEYRDVIAFARGQCRERLGQWSQAAAAFDEATSAATRLAGAARQRAALARRMNELANRSAFDGTLEGYLNDLDVAQRRLAEWVEQKPPFPYESFARAERERAQEERLRILMENRLVLRDGAARAAAVADALIEQNPRAWRINLDRLAQGRSSRRSRETGPPSTGPRGPDWRGRRMGGMGRAGARGPTARSRRPTATRQTEGQARLRALDTYALRIKSQAR